MGCTSYFITRVSLTADTSNRFRWAVCQLDVIQRLKGERRVVQKALKNLPKTLDETYDRLLLTLPEEDHQFVHHTLQLIFYHNNLFGGDINGGIPCTVLVKGVERSIARLTSNQSDRFYDHETLRELCGCLINVTQEESDISLVLARTYRMAAPPQREVLSVSFAHYTVREYLASNRISKPSTAYVTSCKEDLKQQFMEMMFSESHKIMPNEGWDNERCPQENAWDVVEEAEGYFKNYCVASTLYSLCKWPAEIIQHVTLSGLAIDLLNPSKAHFQSLELIAQWVTSHSSPSWWSGSHFWDLKWYQNPSNADAVHLLNLLLLSFVSPEYLSLARKFLQGKDNRDFLRTQLAFSKGESFDIHKEYDGSIIEISAQSAFEALDILRLLLEYGTGQFDPSVILLLFIGRHQYHPNHDCGSDCLVKCLLELGADPNTNGRWVTPLQIAVKCHDFGAIRFLLQAGADANLVKSGGGIPWKHDTPMERFNGLHGASPLYIHRHHGLFENENMTLQREDIMSERQGDSERIEAILLRYGAKSYLRI